jgi:hypothetical protein
LAKRPPASPSGTEVEAARLNFIVAMHELANEDIPNNPLSTLVQEVWPEWQRSGANPVTISTRFRYISAKERRDREATTCGRRREIIEQWARRFGLVSGVEPADWIVSYAENLCLKLSGELREEPTTLGQHGSAQDQKRQAPPWLGGLLVPMADPYQREGESIAQFKKRARRALTVHLHAFAGKRDPKLTASEGKKRTGKCEPQKLDHFKWLVLFQCCRRKLREIRANHTHIDSDQAIWLGVKRMAALVGITLRSKRT